MSAKKKIAFNKLVIASLLSTITTSANAASDMESDFKPTKVIFVEPKLGKPANLIIEFARNLPASVSFRELRVNFWAFDAVGLPVYYGNTLIKCPSRTEAACSAKAFTLTIGAGHICRVPDASAPTQTWPCTTAPAPRTQIQVLTEWTPEGAAPHRGYERIVFKP